MERKAGVKNRPEAKCAGLGLASNEPNRGRLRVAPDGPEEATSCASRERPVPRVYPPASAARRPRSVAFSVRPLEPAVAALYLFLSDLHLGRGSDADSRAAERDAIALLDAHESVVRDAVADGSGGGLYLVGDVFDQFIEYRRLVPKGFVRLLGRIAAWTDAGLPVTYLVGNRDPWHLDYFESELGVRLVRESLTERLAGRTVYLAHGDGQVPSERTYNLLRPVLRHPLAYRLYRTLLPGDSGYRLARRIARRGDGAPDAPTVHGLRTAAHDVLATTPADLVVFGHGHAAELAHAPGGTYLNPGYWFADRTFARLDAHGPSLLRWTDHIAQPFSSAPGETN